MPEHPRTRRRLAVLAGAAVVALVAAGGITIAALGRAGDVAATALPVAGDVAVHDPALVVGEGDDPWYVYSTGDERENAGAVQVRRSTDRGATWEYLGTAWGPSDSPRWAQEAVPGVVNYWAPELYEHDGTWYLYYAASTFGSNRSVIGLRTSPTLDPEDPDYAWTDRGEVWRSEPTDDYNAIDAGIVEDADGTPWMVFGSYWSGIQVVELTWPSGMPADGAEPVALASRLASPHAIEAPYVVPHDGWYYLFVSQDACCQGADSTYRIAVGRSRDVTGPYLTRDGTDMVVDGGDVLLETTGEMVGPGGQSASGGVLGFHFYDAATGGTPTLALREIAWDGEGWPVLTTREEQG
ncbi:arabinan endo-1,5-alpha-L-arabinosidase [Cellulomonas triticagri]|uniref:Arabinan endo-1,5-alpha-L-arabinosidase n=1 Tax=Cellulomonas triticagri TaxID=2483352 RepID=A0A3M2JLN0_9CELL|nr:arabinan endo-1,5-alpha-L-arabinosidase [Cellulomonas triticagri]RMI13146.1 arabinan endo-1,5-alpha-L-arabinosidase [Cellulomonas triticagri]